MSAQAMPQPTREPHLRVDYVDAIDPVACLAQPDVIAVFGFGPDAAECDDPRYLRVPLAPHGDALLEVWRGSGDVESGRDGEVRWSSDGELLFGVIEVAEGDAGMAKAHDAPTA